jgi:hypothetical protein
MDGGIFLVFLSSFAPVVLQKSLNSPIGSPLPYDITFQKRITTIDALKIKK